MDVQDVNIVEDTESCQENNNNIKHVRTRKMGMHNHVDHVSFDVNGNRPVFGRMSSFTEKTSSDLETVYEPSNIKNAVHEEGESNYMSQCTHWENAYIHQIQSLIENVKVSESLSQCINEEILVSESVREPKQPFTRRKSCFSMGKSEELNALSRNNRRKMSVATLDQKTMSLPLQTHNGQKRRTSHAGLESFTYNSLYRQAQNQRKERRSSVTCKDEMTTSMKSQGQKRRISVAHMENRLDMPTLNRRRSSLAHANVNSIMPPSLRRLSCVHDGLVANPVLFNRNRRMSTAKPVSFNVAKAPIVQKRLNKVYRQKRRNERRFVDICDVRKAIRNDSCDNEISDNEYEDVNDQAEEANVDENFNINTNAVAGEIDKIGYEIENENINDSSTDKNYDVSENDIMGIEEELKPTHRRKTSIQVRSWDISRKLRQRRREKRKGYQESDVI